MARLPRRHRLPPVAALCALLAGALSPARAEVVWQAWGVVHADVERSRPALTLGLDDALLPEARIELGFEGHRVGLLAGLAAEWEPVAGMLVFGGLDTGLLAPDALADPPAARGFVDEAAETWLIRSLGVELFADDGRRWSIALGKQRLVIGGGLLVDTAALGADAAFEDDRFGLRVGAWWLGRRAVPRGWPVVRGAAEWRPDLFTTVRLFAAATRFDGHEGEALVAPVVASGVLRAARAVADAWLSGALPGLEQAQVGDAEELIRRLIACADFSAEASAHWLGAEVEALLDGHTLRATAVAGGGVGAIAPDIDPGCPRLAEAAEQLVPPRRFELSGVGLDARWRMRLGEALYVGAFAVAMSGQSADEDPARDSTFGALVAPAPALDRPSLIFGGVNGAPPPIGAGGDRAGGRRFRAYDSLDAALAGERPAVAYGFGGQGVLGGGPTLLLVPHPALEVDLLAAPLWTAVEARRFYGWELDGALRWQPLEALVVRVRGAALWLGDVFPEGGPWWRIALTLEGMLP